MNINIILYTIIFIMGTVFGSFYTLAVYRIPKKLDIVKTHSFCPNCNHKLGFWELIPVWSYLLLGGKCKKCGQKIRPRYLILEILSGLTYVLLAYALKFDVYELSTESCIQFAFYALYFVAIFLIAGIDKEQRKIEKSVLYYALAILLIYIIYLCIIDNTSIYRYIMYLTAIALLLVIDTLNLKNNAKNSYIISLLILLVIMLSFTNTVITVLTIICSLIIIIIYLLLTKLQNKLKKNVKVQQAGINELPIGFCLCVSNVIMLIGTMIM